MVTTLKWFLDTEFIDDGVTVDLISIGLACEDGREIYMVSNSYHTNKLLADPWLKANVLPHIAKERQVYHRHDIRQKVTYQLLTTKDRKDAKPEIWAYYASYDWIALCQLYGRMVDLPKSFPMYCRDLKQAMDERRFGREYLPVQDPATEHSAIEDARWLKSAYDSVFKPGS